MVMPIAGGIGLATRKDGDPDSPSTADSYFDGVIRDSAQQAWSDYRTKLRELLEAKLDGREVVEEAPQAEDAPVVDLMDALRASVAVSGAGSEQASASRTTNPGDRVARRNVIGWLPRRRRVSRGTCRRRTGR